MFFERDKKWLLEEKYFGLESEAFFKDLERLKNGEPVDYLIGWKEFLGTKIDLSFKPLIPREETEFWLYEYLFPELQKKKNEKKIILDIFAGSGCIGLGMKKNFQFFEVDFTDLKEENILQIKKNLKLNNLKADVFQSDIFQNIPEKKYDFILANPPYISKEKMSLIQDSVLKYEDEMFLFAEDDGLFFVKKLILEASKFLKKDGQLWIEYDDWQTEKIEKFLKDKNILNYSFLKDQFGKDRVVKIIF